MCYNEQPPYDIDVEGFRLDPRSRASSVSDFAEIQYKCTGVYNPQGESGILWSDPEIGIKWPVDNPILSEKDSKAQSLSEWLKRKESEFYRYRNKE